jgi:RHS repeat-associated protein
MARPYSIGITGASSTWSLGPYAYDGAGNIKYIGDPLQLHETYVYDKVLRMTSGTIVTGSPAVNRTQTAAYSPYGFITTLTTNGSGQTFSEVPGTNRVSGMCYDNAGSVIGWGGGTCIPPASTYNYTWDPLKQMASTFGSGFTKRTFLYTADGERIEERVGSDPLNPTSIVVSARGLDGKVLRLLTKNGTWSWTKDYVYRDGAQLASVETGNVTKYLHLDHLGTIRRITNTASPAAIIASHDYYPFGFEATSPSQDAERMKWTGHERDQQATPSVQTDDLDYMHARFENFNIGRFLSIDPVRGNPKRPQSFNLFAYARNNPINLVDPLGLEPNSLEPLPSGSIPITKDQVCDPNLVGDPDCPITQTLPPPETPEIKPLPADADTGTEPAPPVLPAAAPSATGPMTEFSYGITVQGAYQLGLGGKPGQKNLLPLQLAGDVTLSLDTGTLSINLMLQPGLGSGFIAGGFVTADTSGGAASSAIGGSGFAGAGLAGGVTILHFGGRDHSIQGVVGYGQGVAGRAHVLTMPIIARAFRLW